MGDWLKMYGESIYGTKRGFVLPQSWGCVTEKGDKVFIHLLKKPENGTIVLTSFPYKKIISATWLKDKNPVSFTLKKGELSFNLPDLKINDYDAVIALQVKK